VEEVNSGPGLAAESRGDWLFYRKSSRSLTEIDSILLTDFRNTTGDAVFDGTLKQALAVQIEQSPHLNVFRLRPSLRQ
jgi:hypothetical protein